jgi:hypothetical protein
MAAKTSRNTFMNAPLGMNINIFIAGISLPGDLTARILWEVETQPSPCANMSCDTYCREISERRGGCEDQPAVEGSHRIAAGRPCLWAPSA